MRCTFPRTVGFKADGKTISWSPKNISKEYATFQLPCGQCLECRLDYARQWAVRCVHESKMHEKNSFITLTYADEHLSSPKLVYSDFQKFMKKLRKLQNEPIGVFVTGEYGEKTKRPHWHAIIFNFNPTDCRFLRSNERGDRIFTSETLDRVWGKGIAEIGSVSFESAGYCARYAAKKLVHGRDSEHDYQPISKKSSKHAIGKKFLEKFWPDIFTHGHIILDNGDQCSIPRYYERWLKENQPDAWLRYVTQTKIKKIGFAEEQAAKELRAQMAVDDHRRFLTSRDNAWRGRGITRLEARREILKSKFKLLQDNLKL